MTSHNPLPTEWPYVGIARSCRCGSYWLPEKAIKLTDPRGGWHFPAEWGAPECKPAAIQTPSPAPDGAASAEPATHPANDVPPSEASAGEGPLAAEQHEYAEPEWDPLKVKVFLVAVAVLLVLYILFRGAYR